MQVLDFIIKKILEIEKCLKIEQLEIAWGPRPAPLDRTRSGCVVYKQHPHLGKEGERDKLVSTHLHRAQT